MKKTIENETNRKSKTKNGYDNSVKNQEVQSKTPHEEVLIESVIEQIQLNKDRTEFNVEKLCRKVGMSYSQLHRKVTLLIGKNPNQLIKEARLTKAKDLLLNHEINIADVAYLSGYNDPSYFSRIFTKEMGITPSEFRYKNKNGPRITANLFAVA